MRLELVNSYTNLELVYELSTLPPKSRWQRVYFFLNPKFALDKPCEDYTLNLNKCLKELA